MPSIKRGRPTLVVLAAALVALVAASVGAASPAARGCTITGTNKNDVLRGTAKADVICGLKGNDVIRGLGGNDTLVGGPGNDTITGGPGLDTMVGGAGSDAFFAAGDKKADRISGGPGRDRAVADPADRLLGVELIRYTAPFLTQFNFRGATFTVGSKQFTEQIILGHITKIALEFTGARVNDQIRLGGTSVNRQALVSGRIDMYWEYTGTGWITHLNKTTPINDARQQWLAVKREDAANGITWLDPAPFDNTYAFAVRQEAVGQFGVRKLSDFVRLLRTRSRDATLCVTNEFLVRDDGLPGVEKHYGFRWPRDQVFVLDAGVIYQSTDQGRVCNFGIVFATDGRIEGLGLTVIADDRKFFPIYNPALNVRTSVFQRSPRLAPMFAAIAAALTNERMQRMNADVDMRGRTPEDVARDFLRSQRLIR